MVDLHATCPDENRLVMSLQGLLAPADREQIEHHIDGCPDCRAQVAQLLKATVTVEADVDAEAQRDGDLLPRGTNLGRYVILDCIGRGGMAIVYSAYDPELDRKVAVKLLRTDLPHIGSPSELRALLLQEAQAMARLSHPSIIAVFDVGTFEEQVFLAMEFIRGRSLRGWLTETARSWREVLQMFLRAGEGLRAAHAAGLVHGDFKPDNVLVGEEDQVRVTDFGLSRPMRPVKSDQANAAYRIQREAPGLPQLAGTPLYLAPEQWRGKAADERSDQFSFCVALYEALYGVRPYSGPTSASFDGRIPDPLKGHSVPLWIRRVLFQGMKVDPAARYSSMDQLLGALSRGLRAARYRRWIAVGAAALLAIGLAADRAVEASARRKAELDLARALEVLKLKWSEQEKLLDLRLEGGLKRDYLLEALGKADDVDVSLGLAQERPEQGIAFAHDLIKSADLPLLKSEDVLLLVDAKGRAVYNHADELSYGQKLANVETINRALSGEAVDALWSPAQVRGFPAPLLGADPPENLLLVFARPVGRGSKRLGAALMGRWVDTSFLSHLQQVVGDHVVLRSLEGSQIGTLPDAAKALEPLELVPTPPLLKVGSTHFLVQSGELAGLGGQTMARAFLLRNFDDELRPIQSRFRHDAIRFGVGTLVLTVAAYLLWASRGRHGRSARLAVPLPEGPSDRAS